MTDDLPAQFVQNLQQVRAASQRITEMSVALDHIDDELRRTGNLAASNLEILKTASERTIASLDRLLTTDGLFDQFSVSTNLTIAALNDATTNFTAEVEEATKAVIEVAVSLDERANLTIARLESSTSQLPQIVNSFDEQLRTLDKLLTQRNTLTEDASAVPPSTRFSLVAPSAIAAVAISATVSDSTTSAAILSSAIIIAGVVLGASWSRVATILKVFRPRERKP